MNQQFHEIVLFRTWFMVWYSLVECVKTKQIIAKMFVNKIIKEMAPENHNTKNDEKWNRNEKLRFCAQ